MIASRNPKLHQISLVSTRTPLEELTVALQASGVSTRQVPGYPYGLICIIRYVTLAVRKSVGSERKCKCFQCGVYVIHLFFSVFVCSFCILSMTRYSAVILHSFTYYFRQEVLRSIVLVCWFFCLLALVGAEYLRKLLEI